MPTASAPRRARFNIGGRGHVPTAREGCAVTSPMIQTCRVNCDEAWPRVLAGGAIRIRTRRAHPACAGSTPARSRARGTGVGTRRWCPHPIACHTKCAPHLASALASLQQGAARKWTHPIFYHTKRAPHLASDATRCVAEVAPPYFLSHRMRAAPCCLGNF